MELEGLVVTKGLKGKQNKKKWNKNIDVSGLLDKIQQQAIKQTRGKYIKPLTVEDTTIQKHRQQLDPNRFKNRPKSQPKAIYDNKYKRQNIVQDIMQDVWETQAPKPQPKKSILNVPAIIKPSSGHSYNPRQQDIKQIINQVIDYEKQRPKKTKKIKKIKQIKVIPRSRNKNVRKQFLEARKRKQQRHALNQIHSIKKIKKQIQQRQKKIYEKIQNKQKQKMKRQMQQRSGKVRQGPKIGKKRYSYKQYIPKQEQIGKKLSHVAQNDQIMREQFDSIFRRGILEPRNVKVHANKTKNIKVVEKFDQQ